MPPHPRPVDPDRYANVADSASATDDAILVRDALDLGLTDWECRELRRASKEHCMPRGTLLVPPVRDVLRARARAAQLLIPDGVLCGRTAARLHGLEGLRHDAQDEPLDLVLPTDHTRWQRAGLRLHWFEIPETLVFDMAGLRVTDVETTLRALQPRLDRRRFICLADSAERKGMLSAERAADLADTLPLRLAEPWRLVDGRAESPSETVVRLVLVEGGLAPDELQLRVCDRDGRVIARLDMGWRRRKVGLEVDSGEHDRPEALYRDRSRQNDLVRLGWTILRVTVQDAWNRPGYVQSLVRGALNDDVNGRPREA